MLSYWLLKTGWMWEGKQPHKYKAWFINTTFTELDHVDTFFNEFFKTEGLIKEYLDTGLILIREFNQVLQNFFSVVYIE